MQVIRKDDVIKYVEDNIGTFHRKRISCLDDLNLSKVLKRKNPYLFKAKYMLTAEEIVKGLVDAYISSNEETIFGDWLEGLAIFVNNIVHGGWKSGIRGIDLEFDYEQKRYLINIKSGPNWGNSAQIKKLVSDFKTEIKTLRTSNSKMNIVCVNGCCYGQNRKHDRVDYFKYCGQMFWEFISNNTDLYTEIIEPLGHQAKTRNEAFQISYSQMINKFTIEFGNDYCNSDGSINWKKLVQFNSSNQ